MRETLDLEQSRLLLDFPDRAELEAYVDRSRGYGFTVRLEQRLEPGSAFELVLTSGATSFVVPTRIKQVFRSGSDRFGTIFEALDWSVLEAPAATPTADDGATDGEADAASPESETSGTSLVFDIRRLNASERIRLASKAQRPERQILLRDPAPPVAMALLSNPRIEVKEVLEIVKNPQAASGVLQRVAQDRRFAGNYEIQLALVKNPKTPSPLAIRFAETLRKNDLRDLSKSQALRENIRSAVLRTYLKRSGQ